MSRKKSERARRLANSPRVFPSFLDSPLPWESNVWFGLLSFVSGIHDGAELVDVIEKCRRRGADLQLDLVPKENWKISSRQLEAERRCSSRRL